MGQLDQKIHVYQVSQSVDASTGQVSEAEFLLKSTWASIGYVGSPSAGSSEENLNGQRTGKMKIEFVFRYFPNLKFDDIIYYEGGRFEIYSIQIIGRKQGYVVRAEMRDDHTGSSPTGTNYNNMY